jgi:hypothetical protein
MVLGESHYEEDGFGDADAGPGLTIEIVCRWGMRPEGRKPFFANLYTVLTGEPWAADARGVEDLWANIFFYNYVQQLVPGGPGHAPTPEMWLVSEPAFRKVLEEVRPNAVLVLGERLWDKMAGEDCELARLSGLGPVCGYRLSDKGVVPAAHTRHPSRGFSPLEWRPKVIEFLDWVREVHIPDTVRMPGV